MEPPLEQAVGRVRLALYQPDIAPNVGTLLRLGACLAVPVDIIEPCGFPFDRQAVRRAAMDYFEHVSLMRHGSWQAFLHHRETVEGGSGRLILLTTQGDTAYHAFRFAATDTLLAGSESTGAPQAVHEKADARVRIPIASGLRSINIALACAIVLGEALRQTNQLPHEET